MQELVDNALNYRGADVVDIRIEVLSDRIIIENSGGRGMGVQDIVNFVSWGGGECHQSDEFSFYHQGGKSAICFFGDSYKLICRRSGESEIWQIEDEQFATRLQPKDYGELSPVALDQVPEHLRFVPEGTGFVRIEISDLQKGRSLSPVCLARELGATYGRLISSGSVRISVNGVDVEYMEPLLDSEVERVPVSVTLGSITAIGYSAKLGRGAKHQPRPGFRLFANGRLIREGEWFSMNPYQKGALSSFSGELEIHGLIANLNKTDFVERSDMIWEQLSAEVLRQAAPILDELRGASEPTRVTDRDRRLAKLVRRELEKVLLDSRGEMGEELITGDIGRKPPEPKGGNGRGGGRERNRTNEPGSPPPPRRQEHFRGQVEENREGCPRS